MLDFKVRHLARASDYPWRELFEHADIVSEGACREEGDGATYYGSTHIRLVLAKSPGIARAVDQTQLRWLLSSCPHARLRAIRVACLEAEVRSGRKLYGVRTEVNLTEDVKELELSVDIEGKLRCAECDHRGATAPKQGAL